MFHTGDVLRKWREAKGWTVQELADRGRLDKNTISRAERGQSIRTDTLESIVKALGHSVRELHDALSAHSADLTDEERELVEHWRLLKTGDRAYLLGLARRFGEEKRR